MSKVLPSRPNNNPTDMKEWFNAICQEIARIKGDEWYEDNAANIKDIGEKLDNLNASEIKVVNADSSFKSDTIEGCLNELFQFVSNFKSRVASAVTDKGVPTLAEDTIDKIVSNIESIKIGYGSGDNIPSSNVNVTYKEVTTNEFAIAKTYDLTNAMASTASYREINDYFRDKNGYDYIYESESSDWKHLVKIKNGIKQSSVKFSNSNHHDFVFDERNARTVLAVNESIRVIKVGVVGSWYKTLDISESSESWGNVVSKWLVTSITKADFGLLYSLNQSLAYRLYYFPVSSSGIIGTPVQITTCPYLVNSSYSIKIIKGFGDLFYAMAYYGSYTFITKFNMSNGSIITPEKDYSSTFRGSYISYIQCVCDDEHVMYLEDSKLKTYNFKTDAVKTICDANKLYNLTANKIAVNFNRKTIYYNYNLVDDDVVFTKLDETEDIPEMAYSMKWSTENDIGMIKDRLQTLYSKKKQVVVDKITVI